MEKKRVMDLARELKISSSALMQILKKLDMPVKSHMSYLDEEAINKIQKMFKAQMEAAKKRQKKRKEYRKKQQKKKIEKRKREKRKKEAAKARKSKSKAKKPVPPKGKPPKGAKVPPKKEKSDATKKKEKKPSYKTRKEKRREEREKKFFSQEKAKNRIKATLSKSKRKKKSSKKKKKKEEKKMKEIVVRGNISANELAQLMDVDPTKIVAKFMELGKMITINQRLDRDSLVMICDEMDFDVNFKEEIGVEELEEKELEEIKGETIRRAPVVAVMGHVDHGKTSILDYIRKTNVVAGEEGGITQHIGAYQVDYQGKGITFIDTPGHQAFTAMRARGADITDIAVIVVAADDGVMPQTEEAIDHAKAAGIPMIFAINKMDLQAANPEKVKRELGEIGVHLQGWGGEIEYVECSAETGDGINELLDLITLTGEVEELEAGVDIKANGTVIEAKLDKGLGPVATILLRNGFLKKGAAIICGVEYGSIRLMLDERNNEVKKCGPSDVVQILGLNGVPVAGDILNAVEDEKTAKELSEKRNAEKRKRQLTSGKGVTLDNLFDKISETELTNLNIIIKADTDGSVEAIADALQNIESEEVAINIVRKSVGGIVEADVDLASASDSIIIGFHVRPNAEAREAAEREGVEIRIYDIIFEVIEDVRNSIEGMLSPIIKEKKLGAARVKQVFKISKVGTIAGCYVEEGKITNDALLRLYRDDIKIYEGQIENLKRFQNDAKEVDEGKECGISIENYNNIEEGDVIEAYTEIKEKKKLE